MADNLDKKNNTGHLYFHEQNGVRLLFCVHDMPTQCPLQLDEVS